MSRKTSLKTERISPEKKYKKKILYISLAVIFAGIIAAFFLRYLYDNNFSTAYVPQKEIVKDHPEKSSWL